jgi:hypothetical protein
MSGDSANLDATTKLILSFIDRIRIAAAHDMRCEPQQNPLQRAYQACLGKLSDEELGELMRIINKLSQQLEAQEFVGHQSNFPVDPDLADENLAASTAQ